MFSNRRSIVSRIKFIVILAKQLLIQPPVIFLDNASTTMVDESVIQSMLPYFGELYGNASSTHKFGETANSAIEKARHLIAEFIRAKKEEIIFTSGSTESLNIAIKGIALQESGKKNKFITAKTEHKAVLDIFIYLEQIGFEIIYLNVDDMGLIDIDELRTEIDNETIGVCIMYVNNETGVIQPISEISEICRLNNTVFICDATQAVGKIPVNVNNIDLLAFSAHKMHGPKGIGALYISEKINLSPIIHGGGHEHSYRSGTMNVPGIIGMAKACELAIEGELTHKNHILRLRNRLEEELLKIEGTKLNGHKDNRSHHISNICFPDMDANIFIRETVDLAVSNGSACSSLVFEPSHVLTAMGKNRDDAYGSLRFSFSKFNSEEDVDKTISIIQNWYKH